MFNIKLSFFSILLLLSCYADGLKGMENTDMVPVVISRSPSRTSPTNDSLVEPTARLEDLALDRSPSRCQDMPAYLFYVENRVKQQEQANPGRKIYLDFNKQLLGLFQRLKHSSEAVKQEWKTAFRILATNLARQHNVCGVKFMHIDTEDFTIASSFIEPFILENKLEKLQTTCMLAH